MAGKIIGKRAGAGTNAPAQFLFLCAPAVFHAEELALVLIHYAQCRTLPKPQQKKVLMYWIV